MPKQRITKEMVVDAAFELARQGGLEQVMVKAIAEKIGCSVQPIYSYCKNMAGLKQAVSDRAVRFVRAYIGDRLDPADPFRSTGRAYIQLARQEPHLFRLFAFHRREGVRTMSDLYKTDAGAQIPDFLSRALSLSPAQARQLHMHMLVYTVGLGTVLSVSSPGIPCDEILARQEQAYQIFFAHAKEHSHDE